MTKIKSESAGQQAPQTKAARRIHRQGPANARRAAHRTEPEPAALRLSDWPDDPSPEEIRRQAAPDLQELLDNPDPRFAKLKAQFVASLADAADALEERLAKVIDAHARRSRETFRVVDGGRR